MKVIVVIWAVVLCTMLSGCAAKYWVAGLTLPPGSTEVMRQEGTFNPSMMNNPAMTAMIGKFDKSLTVAFNCTGGWSAVDAHFKQQLEAKGYTELMSGMNSMMGGMGSMMGSSGLNSSQSAAVNAAMNGMRMYMNKDANYSVMLMDMQGMMTAAGGGAAAGAMAGGGQYSLVIMHVTK
jgi:hypothetical protein